MAYTMAILEDKVERRVRQLVATTSPATEASRGSKFSTNAIHGAINAGRKAVMVFVRNAELWGSAKALITTESAIQDYILDKSVLKVTGVYWDVNAAGMRKSSTAQAVDVKTPSGEEGCILDPMNEPSVTNPKYRTVNKGIRILVSTDGSMPSGKYVLIELIRELQDLTAEGTSDTSETIDLLCVDWAVYVLCRALMPDVGNAARQAFIEKAVSMNRRDF